MVVLKQEQEKQVHLPYQLFINYRIVGSSKKAKQIRALVVTPTRELAVQIGQSFDTYAKYTNLTQHDFLVEYHKIHK
jgi:superfamily II DNA/RNA helicase